MLKYLDTCTPDSFQSFPGLHVYAVPLGPCDTYRSVYDTLAELIAHEEIEGCGGKYTAIEGELLGLRHVAGELGYLDSLFLALCGARDLETDIMDACFGVLHAYFGVMEDEEA